MNEPFSFQLAKALLAPDAARGGRRVNAAVVASGAVWL